MSTTSYELSADSWTDNSTIDIASATGTRIATIPLAFVRQGGDCSWRYILYALGQVLAGSYAEGHVVDNEGTRVRMDEAPSAGRFRFISSGKFLNRKKLHSCIRALIS